MTATGLCPQRRLLVGVLRVSAAFNCSPSGVSAIGAGCIPFNRVLYSNAVEGRTSDAQPRPSVAWLAIDAVNYRRVRLQADLPCQAVGVKHARQTSLVLRRQVVFLFSYNRRPAIFRAASSRRSRSGKVASTRRRPKKHVSLSRPVGAPQISPPAKLIPSGEELESPSGRAFAMTCVCWSGQRGLLPAIHRSLSLVWSCAVVSVWRISAPCQVVRQSLSLGCCSRVACGRTLGAERVGVPRVK